MSVRIITADVMEGLRQIADETVHCVVTSPPYWGLRDYGMAGQIGLEPTLPAYVTKMVEVFREVRRVLRKDGTLWLNLGDSYAGGGNGGGGSYEGERHWRKGSGRADGIVDGRGQRNRDGLGRVSELKPKDLCGVPWRVAFALQADGWWLRQDIIWSKPNPMPESIKDRCTKAHEYLFMLTKAERYYYDAEAIAEPSLYVGVVGQDANGFKNPLRFNGKMAKSDKQAGHGPRHAGFNARWDELKTRGECSETRNKRSVWEVSLQPFPEAHFATFPPALIEPCIKAGSPLGGLVLDPFAGSGTTGLVADRLKRDAVLVELNPAYVEMAEQRIRGDCPMFVEVNQCVSLP